MLLKWKEKFYQLPFYIRFHLAVFGLGFFFLTVYRIVFWQMYSYRIQDKSFLLIATAFLKGFRFDLSLLCILLGPTLVISCIHFANRLSAVRILWRTLPIVFLLTLTFLLVADTIYYENGNKHLGYEAFAYLGFEMLPLIGSAFAQNPALFIAGILGIVTLAFLISKIVRRFPYDYSPLAWWKSTIYLVATAVLLVIGIRGGLQNSPLRTSDAIVSSETVLNDIALNPGFTVITDLKATRVDKRHFMETDEAIRLVRANIAYPGAEFVSETYPLVRKLTANSKEDSPHIVVIVLEGWSGKFIGSMGDSPSIQGKEITPYFNKLLKNGLFFPRFFASGGRTTNGLMALMGGIPDRPGLTAVRTPQILNRFSGLGSIGKTVGYETLFVTGTDLTFNNKGTIMYHWGFDSLVGRQELEKNPDYKAGPWSYLDESSLDALHLRLANSKSGKPMLAVIHTGTTHYPYKVPEERFRLFDSTVQDSEYLNVLHYADWAVNEFLEKAKKSPYFSKTIFAFVSDHSHHRYLNYYEDRNVPLLLYSPGKIKPEIRTDISSQLDFLPTILGFMNKDLYFSGMGRDLRRSKAESAYFAYGNIFGWITNEFLYYQSVTGGKGESWTILPPYSNLGFCYKDINLCKEHGDLTRAFLNLSDVLLKTNKLFPTEKELGEF